MKYSLTISEVDGDNEFRVALFDDAQSEASFCEHPVRNDLGYELVLNFSADDVAIYINGYRSDLNGVDNKIFADSFGYVEIEIVCAIDNDAVRLHSEYIPVLVKNNDAVNRQVEAMAQYVYNGYENFFMTGEHKTLMSVGLTTSPRRSLIAKITLAKEIIAVYESVCGYFKANCKFRIAKLPTVDNLNRIQYISPTTLQYIAAHPENLMQTATQGIRIGNKIFQPKKALTLQNVCSNDIYENQTLLWFLKKMIADLTEMFEKYKHLALTESDAAGDYDYSAAYIFAPLNINAVYRQLQYLQKKCAELFTRYENAMQIRLSNSYRFNGATAIFKSIPQYNKIFVGIYQWHNFGVYDFAKEDFMIRLLTVSLLYERYLLAKMIGYLTARSYRQHQCERVKYSLYAGAKYRLDDFPNKFRFSRDNTIITIYYQPIVDDGKTEPHLYRNNTIPCADDYPGANYYVPDFVIKFESGNRVNYLIVDAKFSSYETVRNFRVRELAFKYLFSLSAVKPNEYICGVCMIYGKCSEHDKLTSAYDRERGDITPKFELLPMMETVNDAEHYANLDKVFEMGMSNCE